MTSIKSENPGPGAYAQEIVKNINSRNNGGTNSFKSMERFPTKSLSHSNLLVQPGPGQYDKPKALESDLLKKSKKYSKRKHKQFAVAPKPTVPSLPKKETPENAYSGMPD